ncbi:methyltransferase domain-containing protein [Homoserinimonas sp. OAct 916]|uniref:methyltransferase domain-containing protein n=1 Tax=Homoserinimonas sp. OAct 916 TaxID=2211450 RepID=UPI0018E522A0|nr:methyltransferase domain-containing protein [Homoserinimonas sp. OAct 916]
MTTELEANRRRLTFSTHGSGREGSIDVLVDGNRIWSTMPGTASEKGKVTLRWPKALVPYLSGLGTIEVRDSSSGKLLATSSVRFGRSASPVEVRDARGRWLVVNKWQRMSPALEGNSRVRELLVVDAARLTTDLQTLGYKVYITGGSLLGAVRTGEILPHDDDIDLAVLLPAEHPSDLSLASFRMEDELEGLGYRVMRHSTAHLQVHFSGSADESAYYIDIFSGFFRDGIFCQPFHVRTPMERSSIVPTTTMSLGGEALPAPAVPGDWLAACYGPDWETPDPSFRFETPPETRRRFENWFGTLNTHRDYWHDVHAASDTPALVDGDAAHLRALSRHLPRNAPVVDLGCGTGVATTVIAQHGHRAVGVDFSARALDVAKENTAVPIDWQLINLADRRRMLEFGVELVKTGLPWHFNLNHVLEGLTGDGRESVFRCLRLALADEAFAFATVDTNYLSRKFEEGNPQTWHLPQKTLRDEARRHGLVVETLSTGQRCTPYGRRRTATVMLRRTRPADSPALPEKNRAPMRRLFSRIFARIAPEHAANRAVMNKAESEGGIAELVRSYEREVRELRAEVDEVRKDSLRIAELYDLVFERLRDGNP